MEAADWVGYSEDGVSPCAGGFGALAVALSAGAVLCCGAVALLVASSRRILAALSAALDSEAGEKVGAQWSAALQISVAYVAAVHWFQDGVGALWADLVAHDRNLAGGAYLAAAGILPSSHADAVPQEVRRLGVLAVAALHTALVLFGFAVGNTVKHIRGFPRRVLIGAALLLGYTLACYLGARVAVVNDTASVRWIASSIFGWPVEDPAAEEHFAFLASVSTALWIAIPMSLSALEPEEDGIAPRVVNRYLRYVLGFYAGNVLFFRYLTVPIWDFLARHSVLWPSGGAAAAATDMDLLHFSKVAATTHTLTLTLGFMSCSILTRVAPRLRACPAGVLVGLSVIFASLMAQWVRYAFAANVHHVTGIAAYFAGEPAAAAAAEAAWSPLHTLVLGSYCSWFAGGVLFEQSWSGAASRPTEEQALRYESTELQNAVTMPIFIIGVVLLLVPAAQLATTLAVAVLLLCLRSHPRSPSRVPRAHPGSYLRLSWADATADCPPTGDQYLVIGVGFVGVRIVRRLLERGERRIRCFDISPENPFAADPRVEYVQGNVCKPEDLERAMAGVDCVYSVFAVIRYWERLEYQAALSYNINVKGTQNVLDACRRCGVKRLVQTSTSNVMATPCLNRSNMDETSPYVSRHADPKRGQTQPSHNHYSWTKALAEQAVLQANCDSLRTVSVRPCSGVFGLGDRSMTDLMHGRFPLAGVQCAACIDYVYVDNVVLGHLKAEARLREGAAGVAGEAFNIGNEEPVTYEDLVHAMQHYNGYKITWRIPVPGSIVAGLARIVELLQWATKGRAGPLLARLGLENVTPACFLTSGMNFNVCGAKARRLLNYRPLWSVDEGIQQTIADRRAACTAA